MKWNRFETLFFIRKFRHILKKKYGTISATGEAFLYFILLRANDIRKIVPVLHTPPVIRVG